MADELRLNIVLEDDGKDEHRPPPPVYPSPAPASHETPRPIESDAPATGNRKPFQTQIDKGLTPAFSYEGGPTSPPTTPTPLPSTLPTAGRTPAFLIDAEPVPESKPTPKPPALERNPSPEKPESPDIPFAKLAKMFGSAGADGAANAAGKAGNVAGDFAAGGTLNPALAIADAAAKAVAAVADGVRATAERLGDVGSRLAKNDNLGALTSAADGAAAALGKIPIVGQAMEAELKAATAVVRAFFDVTQAFVDRGKELQGYSADLSASNARADINKIFQDMREAQELGPEIARLQDGQVQFENAMRELLLPMKRAMLEVMIPIMEKLPTIAEKAVELTVETAKAPLEIQKLIWALLSKDLPGFSEQFAKIFGKVDEISRPKDGLSDLESIGEEQFRQGNSGSRRRIRVAVDPVLGY